MLTLTHPYAIKLLIANNIGTEESPLHGDIYDNLADLYKDHPDCTDYLIGCCVINTNTRSVANETDDWYDTPQDARAAILDLRESDQQQGIIHMLTLDWYAVSDETTEWLDQNCGNTDAKPAVYPELSDDGEKSGWYVHIDDCEPENVPEDLANLITMAKRMSCKILCLNDIGKTLDENPEPSRILHLNKCHISKDTTKILNNQTDVDTFEAFDIVVHPRSVSKENDCWRITIGRPSDEDNIPEDLRACIKLAKSSNCYTLYIDSDGQICENLKKN